MILLSIIGMEWTLSNGIVVVAGYTNTDYGIVAQYLADGTFNILANWNRSVFALQNELQGLPVSLLG